MFRAAALFCALFQLASPASAEVLGYGRVLTNDIFGDFGDKWRTGSYTFGQVRGSEWTGRRPTGLGEIIEYRFRGEIIAPGNLEDPNPRDRPYAATLSLGAHTHLSTGPFDVSLGADVVAVGPQTGLSDFQGKLHRILGAPDPEAAAAEQIDNRVMLNANVELALPIERGSSLIRPFAELRGGTVDLARIGVDLIVGSAMRQDLILRDVTSGQLYLGTDSGAGISFVFGGDVSYIEDSIFLPEDRGIVAEETRSRLRGAVYTQLGEGVSYFYGLTYLSEEFKAQPESQLVGSLKLNFNF